MSAFAMRSTPAARASAVTPRASASGAKARRARPRSPAMRPPSRLDASDPAGQDVRVGRRRPVAAAPVDGRPRNRARALRPHPEFPAGVDRGDAAAPAADLDDLDDRRPDRIARLRSRPLDEVVGRHPGLELRNERALGGRSAHVDGGEIGLPERVPELDRAQDPARGSRLHHRHRVAGGGGDRRGASVRLQDEGRDRKTLLAQPGRERIEIAARDRLHERRQHRRARPLVLAPLAADVGRQRNGHLRPEPAQLRSDGALVRVVGIGVEQTHRDCLDAFFPEVVHDRGESFELRRLDHAPLGIGALGDLAPETPRHEGTRFPEREVEEIRPVSPGDLQDIAENPRVVMSAVLAPWRDRSALMTTVVPCAKNRTAFASTVSVASKTPRSKSGGVLSTLCVTSAGDPVAVVEPVPHEIGERAPHVRRDPHSIHATGPSCRCEPHTAEPRGGAPARSAGLWPASPGRVKPAPTALRCSEAAFGRGVEFKMLAPATSAGERRRVPHSRATGAWTEWESCLRSSVYWFDIRFGVFLTSHHGSHRDESTRPRPGDAVPSAAAEHDPSGVGGSVRPATGDRFRGRERRAGNTAGHRVPNARGARPRSGAPRPRAGTRRTGSSSNESEVWDRHARRSTPRTS